MKKIFSILIFTVGFFIFGCGREKSDSTEPIMNISSGTIKDGQTLSGLLAAHSIAPVDIIAIQKTLAEIFDLRRLQANKLYEVGVSTDGQFMRFVYHQDGINSFMVSRSTNGNFSRQAVVRETTWITKRIKGTVTDNMYRDLLQMGYDENTVANLIAELADNIFAWRIDFFTEQRRGDQFDVLLKQEYAVGLLKPRRLRVLAASYIGSGTKKKDNFALRFPMEADKADYYDLDGSAVRKAFLRAPFRYGNFRVSSGFNPKRLHPILRTYRPHHGTDYAASIGTPVASIGKGAVIHAGWKGGYGKTVEIRHSSKYVSRYGHLSSIMVKQGTSVGQGQTIGRVGTTGLSTGPHLHFEMLVDGRQRNFLRMEFPSATAVNKNDMPAFKQEKKQLLTQLKGTPVHLPGPHAKN